MVIAMALEYLTIGFVHPAAIHNYGTCDGFLNYCPPYTKGNDYMMKFFLYMGINEWNFLPSDLKTVELLPSF
jgi:hypothetical protein